MKTIVTALYAEAAPIIKKYRLQKVSDIPFIHYHSDSLEVIISGTGALNCAVAVSWYLCTKPIPEKLINIGICASGKKVHKIGNCYGIDKIIDAHSNKVWHLPSQSTSLLPRADITTYATPQKKISCKTELIDMESSGFYTAAAKFLQKEKIKLCKIISDYGTEQIPDPAFIHDLIRRNLPLLEKVLASD